MEFAAIFRGRKARSDVDVHPYKNILLPRYRVPQKSVKFVEVVPKTASSATIRAHRNAIMPCNF